MLARWHDCQFENAGDQLSGGLSGYADPEDECDQILENSALT
jgi:hypothetical protein